MLTQPYFSWQDFTLGQELVAVERVLRQAENVRRLLGRLLGERRRGASQPAERPTD